MDGRTRFRASVEPLTLAVTRLPAAGIRMWRAHSHSPKCSKRTSTSSSAPRPGDSFLSPRMVAGLEATGGVLILGIGLRLPEIKRIPVASYSPALIANLLSTMAPDSTCGSNT